MYYSFRCTYCGRLFYTYDTNKFNAAKTLYGTVKQHLIDSNEDDKEYEMDDGASEDSNQIYAEMVTSEQRPMGGFEASHHSGLRETPPPKPSQPAPKTTSETSSHKETTHHSQVNSVTILLLLLAALIIIGIIYMFVSLGVIPMFTF